MTHISSSLSALGKCADFNKRLENNRRIANERAKVERRKEAERLERRKTNDFLANEAVKTKRYQQLIKPTKIKKGEPLEYRSKFHDVMMEIRADDSIRLTGYVNVVARGSRPIPSQKGSFIEQVTPGTFRKALAKNQNVEMRFNHGRKLCDQQSGLQLREDDIGLHADAMFTDAEIAEKGRRNELRGWSFGFSVNREHWDAEGKRHLDDINLIEVSILDKTPAYIATSVEMRNGNCIEYRNGR